MKKDPSKLMTEGRFWSIIEDSNHGVNVKNVIAVSCSDDSFDYFRFWLIARGREVFYKALEDADSLCDVFAKLEDPEDNDYPEQEELDYAVIEVLEERTGDEDYFIFAAERYSMPLRTYEIDFEWDEDDEESIRKICPRTFDKWWGNDVF